MTNALDLALANAAANAPKGEELHLENLDAIANPEREEVILHQYDPNRVVVPEPPRCNSKDVAFNQPLTAFQQQALDYQLKMQTEYKQKLLEPDHSDISYISIDFKLNSLTSAAELTRLRLDALADMITAISTTITTAAQSMPSEPNHKHRSLDEWGDSTLLNELVERENDLMPFYYELLKRIGSSELQSLVMSSMQGKNASMVTLAQLCSALGSMTIQPQPNPMPDINLQESPGLHHSMDARYYRQHQPQSQPIAETEHQRLEQMNPLERQQMDTVSPKSRYFETPPTYNPYFKER